ncbi:hypothetical protein, partial [Pontitalea aquivivens]|uniref:hypothetical protein n=1 Tax=Pontitalea aquivivens TaxID=3388663 RepID=UPI003970A9FC
TTELLATLSPSPLRGLAIEAMTLYGKAWDYDTACDTGDERNVARFFEVIDQIQETQATTAQEAAAKAIVVTLLYECDFPGDAQCLSAGLISDLAGAN